MLTDLRIFVVAGTAVMALAGCSGSDGDAGSRGPASASPTPTGDVRSALVEFTECMRANGYPSFPHPVEAENGQWQMPESTGDVRPPDVCAAAFRNAEAIDAQQETREEVSAEDSAKLRQFAACMRENGVSDWPDPDSEGTFSLPERLLSRGNDPTMRKAELACQKHEPSNGIQVADPGLTPGS
jgi:hypothetical protein